MKAIKQCNGRDFMGKKWNNILFTYLIFSHRREERRGSVGKFPEFFDIDDLVQCEFALPGQSVCASFAEVMQCNWRK
jgi:hypothetical protein